MKHRQGFNGWLLGMMVAGCWPVLMMLVLTGCEGGEKAPAPTPPPTYTGPTFLHGTTGSLATLRGFEPLPVSGYGLVVNLANTGSSEVPAFLRQWLINEMRKKGLGSPRLGTSDMSPERVLASPQTTVVTVQGLIPPGATKGMRFDVLVSAIDTQTTSLEGGLLWTTDLAVGGANPQMLYSTKIAAAAGPLYINPFDDSLPQHQQVDLQRQAVVLSGGMVTENREIELVLNQPNWQRSRLIADRINERYPKGPSDREDTAVPKTDLIIKINVPQRYMGQPVRLLRLISKVYLQRSPNFEVEQARRLGEILASQPGYAEDVALAWQSLGNTARPVIRQYYAHPNTTVRLTALEAGANLEDEQAVESLAQLAKDSNATIKTRCAELLMQLPRSLRGSQVLQQLLNDPDRNVRIAAYESLARINDPVIQRTAMGSSEQFKFLFDLVPSNQSMVYISQAELPRLVIFNPMTSFKMPMVSRLWDNRLLCRATGPDQPLTVFYQPLDPEKPMTHQAAPTVANLIFLMAHQPDLVNPTPGLNLSYSQVVSALYGMHRQGVIPAELVLQINSLAAALTQAQQNNSALRPETSPTTAPADLEPTTVPANP